MKENESDRNQESTMNIIEAMDKYPEAFKRPGDGDLTDSKVRYWIAQVLKTRRFGSTYIHADSGSAGNPTAAPSARAGTNTRRMSADPRAR